MNGTAKDMGWCAEKSPSSAKKLDRVRGRKEGPTASLYSRYSSWLLLCPTSKYFLGLVHTRCPAFLVHFAPQICRIYCMLVCFSHSAACSTLDSVFAV